MRKSISISIRVSEDELEKFKEAARLEAYASYSEFVRRTALMNSSLNPPFEMGDQAKPKRCLEY